ncbi:unnamed protein product [Vitrella brassicaformis CCMP3155]|uniref:Uncharacterized protein n=1 Tax=Vitrella brassicaformis (strain CCMP3155) TaxID=1169540 RepID=A0A0G4G656_VITBC|nr:unnamed protein product [Vitrella brassicaformis CCMP3155]|eukprot:CEM23732.1 unnamed protein product [Vitrella brassicaformis CCMP3155]
MGRGVIKQANTRFNKLALQPSSPSTFYICLAFSHLLPVLHCLVDDLLEIPWLSDQQQVTHFEWPAELQEKVERHPPLDDIALYERSQATETPPAAWKWNGGYPNPSPPTSPREIQAYLERCRRADESLGRRREGRARGGRERESRGTFNGRGTMLPTLFEEPAAAAAAAGGATGWLNMDEELYETEMDAEPAAAAAAAAGGGGAVKRRPPGAKKEDTTPVGSGLRVGIEEGDRETSP